jgi:uncharacterized membrane protein YkvA (DUF1232 family)/plasmid maintenance system antidote protein VapI
MPLKEEITFGMYLRDKIEQVGLSIRKLAHECAVDPATISRLISGKQKPRPEHLMKIAHVLNLNVTELWQAAGYMNNESLLTEPSPQPIPHHASYKRKELVSLQSEMTFDSYTLPPIEGLDPARIQAELDKYQLYAQTNEGQAIILQEFDKKLDQIKSVGPFINKLQALYKLYLDVNTDQEKKHIIGGLLLYFILPTDIIPDYLFPIGYLDDAMATDIIWEQIQELPC